MSYFFRAFYSLCVIVGLLFMSSAFGDAVKLPSTIRLATTSELITGKSYRFDLTTLILEATKAEYGDYRFEFYMNAPGASRQAMLLREGDLVNVIWGSPGTVTSKVGAIVIPTDVYRGLLGRRVCIINSNNKTLFDKVTNFDLFQHIRVGQGLDWPDIEIYKFNKMIPVQAPSLDGLFGMLTLNRFDCLALGINEVDQFYQENLTQFPSLAVEKNLLIYYDLPTYIYVSPQYPKLAARLKKGLKKVIANGDFDRLFERYFYDKIVALNLPARRVICLTSPYAPANKQCKELDKVNDMYKSEFFPNH